MWRRPRRQDRERPAPVDSLSVVVIKAPAVLAASADDREVPAVHQVRVMVGPVDPEETHRSVVRSAVQDRAEGSRRRNHQGVDNDRGWAYR